MEVLPTLDVGEAVVLGDATLLSTRIKMSKPKHEPRSGIDPLLDPRAPTAQVDQLPPYKTCAASPAHKKIKEI